MKEEAQARQPGPPCLTVRKSATPVCGAWNPLGTQISALDGPRSCGLGNAPIPYVKRVSEAGDICQHFRRQPYRLLLRHGLRPGRNRLNSPSFPALTHVIPAGSRLLALIPIIPAGSRLLALTHVIPRTPSRHSLHSPTSFPRRRESSVLRDWTHPMEGCRPQPSCRKSKRQGRQPSPEANMPRALPSAPYFSIGAPTMLPYSVQEPS